MEKKHSTENKQKRSKQAATFAHLGSMVQKHSKIQNSVNVRIGKASTENVITHILKRFCYMEQRCGHVSRERKANYKQLR
jgi:hypothetical protein